jgi:uncharacterized damage-inducible protein DinB
MPDEKALRKQLIKLLESNEAHATFEQAVQDFPAELRGKKPKNAEHSAWQLLDHLRVAQHDILDFSIDPAYKSMEWPKDYWPAHAEPPHEKAWDEAVAAYHKDRQALCDLVANEETDLFAKIPHGDGQTILREVLLVADHNAYHIGQLVLLRRLLGVWG